VAKRKSAENISGSTFADLYDLQTELSRQATKPLGRPRKKVERKPTTIYLTKEEGTMLRRLHLMMGDYASLNKSEIVGIAIEIISELIAEHDDEDRHFLDGARNVEDIKRRFKALLTP